MRYEWLYTTDMKIPEEKIAYTEGEFVKRVKKTDPVVDEKILAKAYQFAVKTHAGQTRYSGEPYVNHALETAIILAEWRLHTPTIVAGLLHDTVEDGEATAEQLEKEFGSAVAQLVEGVTKISNIRLTNSKEELFVENLRKMIVAMSKDLRVVLVKLADRLHNMRTLEYIPLAKQRRIAQETLEVYAPLADRLGMGHVKGQLDDLAFPYVDPEGYAWVKEYAAPYYVRAKEDTESARKELMKTLAREGIGAEVQARTKRLYSLYQKLKRKEINKDITQVNDLVALRVLTDSIPHCYIALGIVHGLWKPVPSLGISDFIAQPKPNGYKSIHTKVFMHNRIAEIQIRTKEMHEEAEYGIASHWYYEEIKSSGKLRDEKLESGQIFTPLEKMGWVRQMVEMLKDIQDNKELITNLKTDMFQERIFVYTPKGDVIDLPMGATPIDFAFAIHTDLGHFASGARVNGKLVSLNFQLRSGDICEVLKSKSKKKASRDWLRFVITSSAKSRIMKSVRGEVGRR